MHDDEFWTDPELVRSLVDEQFPAWAVLDLVPVPSDGTDNALYRLGAELVVRLPRVDWAVESVEREQRWLPWLAPRLPVAVPVPVALGRPTAAYPYRWSVYGWLPGRTPVEGHLAAPDRLADDLARFVAAMRALPTDGAPSTDRGVPLADRDEATREALRALADLGPEAAIDLRAAEQAWHAAVAVPAWDGPPVWLHGDLGAGNLLLDGGRLHAVIDFGLTGTGDPAADLVVAWNLLPAAQRGRFAAAVAVDPDTWARGRGWALSRGLVALPYYARRHPPLAVSARYVIAEVLRDLTDGGR